MKRLMPSSLITFLQAIPNCLRADLFTIALPTGVNLYATSGQFDISVPSGTPGWTGSTTTFSASTYGVWGRGAITSEASFDLGANTMSLSCIPQQGTQYPGLQVGLLSAAFNGLFDAAQVTVQTAYMPFGSYGTVTAGIETKFFGCITSTTDITRTRVEFEAADYLYLLNLKVPTRLMQSNCPWSLCDANCGLAASTYTTSFTAATGSTSTTLIPSTAFAKSSGYYSQGVVKCLTGTNAGLAQTVKLQDTTGHLLMTLPWLLRPNVGDTFSVIAGCDKTVTTCTSRFSNLLHFGGEPFVPVSSTAV